MYPSAGRSPPPQSSPPREDHKGNVEPASVANKKENSEFNLMHPAFQNPESKLKASGDVSKNPYITNPSPLFRGGEREQELSDQGSDSDSEEIDLTTNGGCIDYSNNNKQHH